MEVFATSPWVPAEWILGHGLQPRGVWFAREFGLRTSPVGAGVCAFANATVALAERHTEAAVIFTTHCDQLRRGFDSVVSGAPARRFLFNLPATWQTGVAEKLFLAELERLGRFLVGLGGRTPTGEALGRIMADHRRARTRLVAAAVWCSGRRYAEALARFHWDASIHLPDEPQAPQPATNGVPLALVGGPLPRAHWGLLDAIEAAGGRVVLNATEAGERSVWPQGRFINGAGTARPQRIPACCASLEQLARDYLDHCVDVFQRPNTRLYAWLRERLAARHVRGILLWHYVGCDLWRAEGQSLREAFELPVLLLEADAITGDLGRNMGRIEAFLEALR